MLFTSVTMRFTCSTEGNGASVAGIIPTSRSVCFDSSATFFRSVSFILFLSILVLFSAAKVGKMCDTTKFLGLKVSESVVDGVVPLVVDGNVELYLCHLAVKHVSPTCGDAVSANGYVLYHFR